MANFSRRHTEILMLVGLVAAFGLAISVGTVGLGVDSFLTGWQRWLSDAPTLSTDDLILWDVRLPRATTGALVGAGLGAAGVLAQGLFRNALASPSVLGVTSGAGAAAALTVMFMGPTISWWILPLAGWLGAVLSLGCIMLLVRRGVLAGMEALLLAGFALNASLGALTSLVSAFLLEEYDVYRTLQYWLMGSLNGRAWSHVAMGLLPISVGLVLGVRLSSSLDLLSLGEDNARSLGLATRRLRFTVPAVLALLVGGAVSMAGAISFVGLIVPHITRHLLGPHHRRLFLFSTVNGATLVLVADTLSRILISPRELPTGVMLMALGAPFFLGLLLTTLRRPRWL